MGEIFDEVAKRVGEVALPDEPKSLKGVYALPEDPSLLSSDEVSRWMFRLAAWSGFVLRNLALADVEVAEARLNYDLLQQQALMVIDKKGKTKNQLFLEAISIKPEIIQAKKELIKEEAEAKVWESLHKLYESQVAVLSREITRRISEQK